jgi:hypothetical protein
LWRPGGWVECAVRKRKSWLGPRQIFDERKLHARLRRHWEDACAAIGRAGRFLLAVLRATRVMFSGVHSMVAGHGTAVHTHRLRRRRLIGMRQLHRTAIQNERKREDDRKQGFLQAKTHDGSRAKSPANVHRIVFGEENCYELRAKPCSVLRCYESRPPQHRSHIGGMVSGLDIKRWPSGSGILMSE